MSIKKKLITQEIFQATMSIFFSAHACVACRFQSIFFDYQCDSVSSMAFKFRNHAAASQHSLPILITGGEKIMVLYVTFTYISSQGQKYLQISIFGLRPAGLLFCLSHV